MKLCDGMYFLLGQQFCKYTGFYCSYQGEEAVMKIGGEQGAVTYCTLNNIERLLEDFQTDD